MKLKMQQYICFFFFLKTSWYRTPFLSTSPSVSRLVFELSKAVSQNIQSESPEAHILHRYALFHHSVYSCYTEPAI